MAFEMDAGSTGNSGPFLVWTPRGTQDGDIGPKTFYVRRYENQTATKEAINALDKGAVFDFATLKTGWQESDGAAGQAPKWVWGTSPKQLPPSPGDGWKKGFSIKVAISANDVVFWEQSGIAVWQAMVDLAKSVDLPAPDQCPVVKLTGTELMTFGNGKTVKPVLSVVKYVPRPAALKEAVSMDTGGDDWGSARATAAKKPEPAMTDLDDDVPF